MRLFLEFDSSQTPVHRERLTYAFRVFCAIYGHQPVTDVSERHSADAWLSYRVATTFPKRSSVVRLSKLYAPRRACMPAPPPFRFSSDAEETVLFYAPAAGDVPDWLGEIFEWVSCADEYSVTERDSVGRIPFAASYLGRHRLDISRPYAAIAMHLLQRELCKVLPATPARPTSPTSDDRHFIINTHDVDFVPLTRIGSAKRSFKNAFVSLLQERSPGLALRQVAQALGTTLGGRIALDQLPDLLAGERRRAIGASYFFIAAQRHRRDANYTIDAPELTSLLQFVGDKGMEIGLHGSYTSLDSSDALANEAERLAKMGFRARGGRQHWLRYTLDRLIPAVESAGMTYDASVGWSDRIGFRSGCCFAYPPYDFVQERAAEFLETPLVIMDQALQCSARPEDLKYQAAANVLSASRRYGWGGVSVLWHPTGFGGCQLSPGVGDIYWRLLDDAHAANDEWMSGEAFCSAVLDRYKQVGLLPRAPTHSAPTNAPKVPSCRVAVH